MKRLHKAILLLFLLAVLGGFTVFYFGRGKAQSVVFRTVEVTRGDMLVAISATGTLEPEEVVDVGAQVAGQIVSFGKDAKGKTVDYGSAVEAGMVLAQIDDSLYSAESAQAQAQVQSARASVQRSESDLEQLKAKYNQAERDWARAQKLGPSEALAQSTYDAYKSAFETAKANVAVGEAAILQAKASVAQAEAVLRRGQRNLGYCTIRSPVKGVIIDRRVNIGQTVVASLNAPSLFLIAKDLTRMQVWVAVNEADIGKIRPGQAVTFTVDAFPGESFRGEVGKVRLNASMTQNVVTYTVEIITDNASGRLLPYLTANVRFELSRRNDVVMVPNAGLRWKPSADQVAPEFRETANNPGGQEGKAEGGRKGEAEGGRNPKTRPLAGASSGEGGRGVLWVGEGEYVRPIRVRTGLSDGANTEVEGENLSEGVKVVVGLDTDGTSASTQTTNPFVPQFPRRGARR
jgi:HlyD family secretion protein